MSPKKEKNVKVRVSDQTGISREEKWWHFIDFELEKFSRKKLEQHSGCSVLEVAKIKIMVFISVPAKTMPPFKPGGCQAMLLSVGTMPVDDCNY